MRDLTVFTTFPDNAPYIERTLRSFDSHWESDIHIVAFYEKIIPPVRSSRIHYRPILSLVPYLDKWRTENASRNGVSGNKYDYNFDAVKFSACSLVRAKMILESEGMGTILWIDADSITHETVTKEWIFSHIPEDCFSAHLGRKGYHIESAFVSFNPDYPGARDFGMDWEALYRKGGLFDIPQGWHDCWVYEHLKSKFQDKLKFHNISPNAKAGDHVFVDIFGERMDHLKGPRRKKLGYSPERKVK